MTARPAHDAPEPRRERRYDAFISYSHAADGELAPTLQSGLERLGRSWRQHRALKVFRDRTGLALTPDLWGAIAAAMDDAEWFVLLCSPAAAQSEWVGLEIEHWLATRGPRHLLLVVTEKGLVDEKGITWDGTTGGIDLARSPAAHPALDGVFRTQRNHTDLSWARTDTDLTLRNARFRSHLAEIAAPMHGLDMDELEGEHVQRQRQVRRLVGAVVAVLTVLVLVAGASAVVAVRNGREAERQRDEAREQRAEAELQTRTATSRRLADLSGAAGGELGALLAVQAHRMAATPQATGAMIAALEGSTGGDSGVVGRLTGHADEVVSVAHSSDGAHVVTVDSDGAVRAFTATGGAIGGQADLDAADAEILGDDVVAAATPAGVALLGLGAREADLTVDVGGPVRRVARIGDRDVVLAGTESGAVALLDHDGEVVARAASAHTDPVRFVGASRDGTTVVSFASASEAEAVGDRQAGGTVVVHDPSDLSEVASWRTEGGVLALAPDGTSLAVAAEPGAPTGAGSPVARLVDPRTGTTSTTLHTFEPSIARAAAFTPSGEDLMVLTTGGVDGAPGQAFLLPVSDERTGDESFPDLIMESNWSVSVAPDGSAAVIGGSESAAPVVTLGHDVFGGPVPLDGVHPTVPISASTEAGLVTVARDGQVGVADLTTGTPQLMVTSAGEQAAVSPDGSRLLTTEGLVDVATGETVGDGSLPPPRLDLPPTFSADGGRVAYAVRSSSDDEVAVVDLADGTLVATGHAPAPLCTSGTTAGGDPFGSCEAHATFVALSPDGTRVALRPGSTGPDTATALEVVDVTDEWSTVAVTETTGGGPVAFSEDGTELVVQAGDVVRRHDATTLAASGGGRTTELSGRWEAEGDALVVVGPCGVTLTDPVSLRPVAAVPIRTEVVEGGCETVVDATWIDGGTALLTADDDCFAGCELLRWELDPDALATDLCARTGRNLTADEWDQFLADFAYERTCEQWPAAPDAEGGGTEEPAPSTDEPATTTIPEAAIPEPSTVPEPSTIPADEGFATIEALLDVLYGRDPDLAYLGSCTDVPPDVSSDSGICTHEIRRDGPEVVIVVARPHTDHDIAYHRLTEGIGGWIVAESFFPSGEEAYPSWIEGDG